MWNPKGRGAVRSMSLAFERAAMAPKHDLGMSNLLSAPPQDHQIAPEQRTDLVPVKPVSHLATEVYELLPRASEKVARLCAEILASSGHMTQSLAFIFLARGDRSSLIALAGAHSLPPTLLLHRASSGTIDEARAVASRAHLDPLLLAALCDRHDPVLDYLIAECPTLIDAHRVVDQLLLRARKDQKLASQLLERDDLSFHQRAKLFEKASVTQRKLLIREATEEALMTQQQDKPPCAPPISLINSIERGDRDDVLSALTASCGMSASISTLRPRLDHPDGAIATLAGLSLGMDKKEIPRLLNLIGVDPVLKLRPGGAIDLLEQLEYASAKILLDAMNARSLTRRNKMGQEQTDRSHPATLFFMDAVA